MTNADAIRSMTDEELVKLMDEFAMGDIDYAQTFCDLCNGDSAEMSCDKCRMEWLHKESTDTYFGIEKYFVLKKAVSRNE